jgi:gas vesicle protein
MAKNYKDVLIGAALGTLLGSITSVLMPEGNGANAVSTIKSASNKWSDKAREVADAILEEGKEWLPHKFSKEHANDYWKGILIGLALGAGSTLMFDSNFRDKITNELSHGYKNMSGTMNGKTKDLLKFINKYAISLNNMKAAGKKVKRALAKKPTARKTTVTRTRTTTRKRVRAAA